MKIKKDIFDTAVKHGKKGLKGTFVSNIASEVGKKVAPLVGDMVSANIEKQQHLIKVPKVVHMTLQEAETYLTDMGFYVTKRLAKPNASYQQMRPGDIVKIKPRCGSKVEKEEIITIFYVDQHVLDASDRHKIEFHNVVGLRLDRAVDHLKSLGLQVEVCKLQAHKKYHLHHANTVIKMTPQPNVFKTRVRGDKIIKLYTLDQETIDRSIALKQAAHELEFHPKAIVNKFLGHNHQD